MNETVCVYTPTLPHTQYGIRALDLYLKYISFFFFSLSPLCHTEICLQFPQTLHLTTALPPHLHRHNRTITIGIPSFLPTMGGVNHLLSPIGLLLAAPLLRTVAPPMLHAPILVSVRFVAFKATLPKDVPHFAGYRISPLVLLMLHHLPHLKYRGSQGLFLLPILPPTTMHGS